MRKIRLYWLVLALYAAAALSGVAARTEARAADEKITPALIERGAYLAKAGDCVTCHTAEKKGMPKFAGGYGMNTPFGKIYSTNITPDPQYGIGKYTYEDFKKALREGIARDGRYLYPAMPYPSFRHLTEEDMRALYAFFMKAVEPVAYAPPQTALPFPFSQRWGIRFWNRLFLPSPVYKPDQTRSEQWNRGAYLVQGLGHCGACHTPRGLVFNEKGYAPSSRLFLTGQTLEHWYAPNLRGDLASGLGRWEEEDIVSFLKTGYGHGSVAFGTMKDVVENSTQYLKEDDLAAIAVFLKSLAPAGKDATYRPRRQMDTKETYPREYPGAGVYAQYCARCHMPDGIGRPPRYPHLAGSSVLLSEDPRSVIRLVLEGGSSPKTRSGSKPAQMPSFAGKLNDTEIANALTFTRQSWGNAAAPITREQVAAMRKTLDSLYREDPEGQEVRTPAPPR